MEKKNTRGSLKIKVGPVSSGKTTWLMGELLDLCLEKIKVIIITYKNEDSKPLYNLFSSQIKIIFASKLSDVDISTYQVIGIDKGHMFEDIYEKTVEWLNLGVDIRIVGLDSDKNMNPYTPLLQLCSHSDNFNKIKTKCRECVRELKALKFNGSILSTENACFSKMISQDNTSKYIPVCLNHHPEMINDIRPGTCECVTGCMFSGKTTWLINELTLFAQNGFNVVLIRFSHDNRKDVSTNDGKISTHNKSYGGLDQRIKIVSVQNLSDVQFDNCSVVGIDEAHFFESLLENVKMLMKKGIHVRLAGLDGLFNMEPFNNYSLICSISNRFDKLLTRCHDCIIDLKSTNFNGDLTITENGAFSARIKQFDGNVHIGGSDTYIPVCSSHHAFYK